MGRSSEALLRTDGPDGLGLPWSFGRRQDTPVGLDVNRAAKALRLAEAAARRGATDRARRLAIASWTGLAGGPSRDIECRASALIGRLLLASHRWKEAEAWLQQATGAIPGSRNSDIDVLFWLGVAAFHCGKLDLACTRWSAAEVSARRAGASDLEIRFAGMIAWLWALQSGSEPALDRLRELARSAWRMGAAESAVRLEAHLGILEARRGRGSDARRRLEAAKVSRSDSLLDVLIEAAQSEMDRIEGVRASSSPLSASPRQADGIPRHQPTRNGLPLDFAIEVDVLRRSRSTANVFVSPYAPPSPVRVERQGSWFQAPGMERVDCRRRPVLRRLVVELARQRLARPGEPIAALQLFAVGWPDQNICQTSAKNRLKVAISTLRKMGFGQGLIGDRSGYRISADVPVELIEPDAPDERPRLS